MLLAILYTWLSLGYALFFRISFLLCRYHQIHQSLLQLHCYLYLLDFGSLGCCMILLYCYPIHIVNSVHFIVLGGWIVTLCYHHDFSCCVFYGNSYDPFSNLCPFIYLLCVIRQYCHRYLMQLALEHHSYCKYCNRYHCNWFCVICL